MTNIKYELHDQAVQAAFNRLLAAAEQPDAALNAIGRVLKTHIQLGFHTGTDPYGQKWAPLKTRSGQPLRDKGHLMGSIDYQVEGNSVTIGTNMSYAPTHQFGATIEAKNAKALRFIVEGKPVFIGRGHKITIPPRTMFPLDGLPGPWRDDIVETVIDLLAGEWNQ
ncbi:MAG: phage virion morphogenesis protein [Burkholderiales bacterium]|nr:phage virion morphogenesis protein [Burkholderiales bacterium]